MIGIVDIGSLGYYKYYKFEEAGKLCEYFNKFVNTPKKDREQVSPVDKISMVRPRRQKKKHDR